MRDRDQDETQPSSPNNQYPPPQSPLPNQGTTKKVVQKPASLFISALRRNKVLLVILLSAAVLTTIMIGTGAFAGYFTGRQTRLEGESAQVESDINEQFNLGIVDLAEGDLELARQRLEYVLSLDPSYPGAADRMAEVLYTLYATASPTPQLLVGTPSPTFDPRPAQELFAKAENLLASRDWNNTIETLVALRKNNPAYETARVDGMLYLALRYRGVDKILSEHNLEGGIYDLALAENFSLLDVEARNTRNWARLYIIGSSFWEVFPQQAVYYFGQVASAAPYLRDASGWTARDRYREALIQYGDQLADSEEWCAALIQYEIAYSIRADEKLSKTIEAIALQCSPPTATISSPTITFTPTITGSVTTIPTITGTLFPTISTPSPTLIPSATPGQPTSTGLPPSPTPTQPQATTEIPPTPVPTDTPAPPEDPTATPTP